MSSPNILIQQNYEQMDKVGNEYVKPTLIIFDLEYGHSSIDENGIEGAEEDKKIHDIWLLYPLV